MKTLVFGVILLALSVSQAFAQCDSCPYSVAQQATSAAAMGAHGGGAAVVSMAIHEAGTFVGNGIATSFANGVSGVTVLTTGYTYGVGTAGGSSHTGTGNFMPRW